MATNTTTAFFGAATTTMTETRVLDKGYVKLVPKGCWGSDEMVIEAARMSVDGGFVSWEPYEDHPKGDAGLLKYLWTHRHSTPFEMAGATFEIYAPIFVIREWHRHRTQSYNEMSGRYIELPNDYYIPEPSRIKAQAANNRQDSSVEALEDALEIRGIISDSISESRKAYELLLDSGVAREVARMVLPVSQYSRFRACANLWNWFNFLRLRLHESAQWEIRQFAIAVAAFIEQLFPRTYDLFVRQPS